MSRVKQACAVVALVLALAAPIARAEEAVASPGWLEELVAQIVAAVVGHTEPPEALSASSPGPELELGEHVPVSG